MAGTWVEGGIPDTSEWPNLYFTTLGISCVNVKLINKTSYFNLNFTAQSNGKFPNVALRFYVEFGIFFAG